MEEMEEMEILIDQEIDEDNGDNKEDDIIC